MTANYFRSEKLLLRLSLLRGDLLCCVLVVRVEEFVLSILLLGPDLPKPFHLW